MGGKSFRFGPFRFDADRGILHKNGQPSPLGGRAATLLRVLLEARGNVVTKSDLMDAAWPCLNVEESNLTVQLSALRRCLGDDRRRPTWIETFHRTGYRFAGPIAFEDEGSIVGERPNPHLPGRPAITVLPFELTGRAALHPHVVAGFHDALVVELSRLPVILTTTGRGTALAAAMHEFVASDFRIGGRVGFHAENLQVEVVVSDLRPASARETRRTIEGDLSDLFRVQREVARQTAALLRTALTGNYGDGGFSATDIAHRYYDQGCRLLVRSHSANRSARWHLSRAVELNPGFAKAHAFLGIGHYTAAIHYGEDVRSNRALALAYAKRAVSLDREEATTHGALGFVKLYDGHLADAEDCLHAALDCNPRDGYALLNMAELRVMQGRHDDAVTLAEQAIREASDPPGWYYWILAFGYYAAGRYSDAVESLRHPAIENFPGKRILSASLAQLGFTGEARLEAENFLAAHPEFRISGWSETQPFAASADRRHFIDGFRKAGLPL